MPSEDQMHAIVRFEGEMTLRSIASAWERLCESFAASDTVVVDVDALTKVDVSFIQLLLSAERTAAVQNKHLYLSSPAHGVLYDALVRGGFVESPAGGSELWKREIGV